MLLLPSASASQIIALTGLAKTTVYRAMSEFKEAYDAAFVEIPNIPNIPNFPKSPTSGNNEIPNIPTDGNCSQKTVPKVPPVGILPCAPASITTHANIELSTKVLLPSEVKEGSEVSKICLVSQKAKPKPKNGTRLPADWELPNDWFQWTRVTFPASTAEQVRVEGESFADFWHGKPGAAARKLDWEATWRNWCRKGLSRGPMRPGSFNGPAQKARGTYRPSISEMAQALEELEAEREFAQ